MGAGNWITLSDLRVFVNQAAKPIPAENPDVGARSRQMRTPGRRALAQCPVRPVTVVVIDLLVKDQPQVPFAGDQHPVQALAAGAGDPAFGDRVRTQRPARSIGRASVHRRATSLSGLGWSGGWWLVALSA